MSPTESKTVKPVVHDQTVCDNCDVEPIRGPRFRCINCQDFDLCALCEPLNVHDTTHTFLKISTPTPSTDFPWIPVPVGPASASRWKASLFNTTTSQPSQASRQSRHDASTFDPQRYQSAADAINKFGFRLQLKADNAPGICPLNIYQCLLMALAGAGSNTRTELATLLQVDATRLEQSVARIYELESFCRSSSSAELLTAASVWYNPKISIAQAYMETLQYNFQAHSAPISASAINQFAKENTNGRITDIVNQSIESSWLVLVTCLYFKAQWTVPFKKASTSSALFHAFDSQLNCQMMQRHSTMAYHEDSQAQICILPYRTDNAIQQQQTTPQAPAQVKWNAMIILPRTNTLAALQSLQTHIASHASAFRSIMAVSTNPHRDVHLSLPRFTLRSKTNLTSPLSALGVRDAFSQQKASFPHIVGSEQPAWIDAVEHHVFVEVNEEGTEVAAVTSMNLFGAPMPQYTRMCVDRPFLFVVFEAVTGLVLVSATVGSGEGCTFS